MSNNEIKNISRHETIFSLIDEAINNNGYVEIYNWRQDKLVKNQKDAISLMNSYFRHTQKSSWLIMDISGGRSKNITAKQRNRLKELEVKYKDNGISFNLYEFFKIPYEKRTVETLNYFKDFFYSCKRIFLIDPYEVDIQFCNEYAPKATLKVNIEGYEEEQLELQAYISNEMTSNWFKLLLKELGLMGRYSWFFINESLLVTTKEEIDLVSKKYGSQ